MRLNSDGSLDTNFGTNVKFYLYSAPVRNLLAQQDGKILVSMEGGASGFSPLIRLNPDGSSDGDFRQDAYDGSISSLALDRTGQLLVTRSLWDHSAYRSLLRLNPDGSLDSTFRFIPLLGEANSISVLPNGVIFLGGLFDDEYTGAKYFVERFNPEGSPTADLKFTGLLPNSFGEVHLSLQGQLAPGFLLQASADLSNWETIATNRTPSSQLAFIDKDAAAFRQRFYRARALPH